MAHPKKATAGTADMGALGGLVVKSVYEGTVVAKNRDVGPVASGFEISRAIPGV